MRFSFWENGLTEVKTGCLQMKKKQKQELIMIQSAHDSTEKNDLMLSLNQVILAEKSRGYTTASHFPLLRFSAINSPQTNFAWVDITWALRFCFIFTFQTVHLSLDFLRLLLNHLHPHTMGTKCFHCEAFPFP